jgi:hypothetical protein
MALHESITIVEPGGEVGARYPIDMRGW